MIKDLKELQALLKLCRKQGVTSVKLGEISINFGDLPSKPSGASEDEEVEEEGLTPEQLMFFSAGGAPP